MPKLAWVFAATTLFAGSMSVLLWQQLHAEHERAVALEQRLLWFEESQLRASAAGMPAQSLPPETSLSQPGQPARDAGTTDAGKAPAGGVEGRNGGATPPVGTNVNPIELLKDPDFRAAMEASMRAGIAQNYPDLARELGLSREQASKLLDLLARQQAGQMATFATAIDASDPQAVRGRQAQVREQQRIRQEEVKALLGEGKYAQWEEYQDSLAARLQVKNLRTVLEANGNPLEEESARQLVAALVADQKAQAQAVPAVPTGDQKAMVEDSLRRMEENNRRSLDVASSYLSAEQLEVYRKFREQETSMARAMMRVQQRAQAAGEQAGND